MTRCRLILAMASLNPDDISLRYYIGILKRAVHTRTTRSG